MSKSQRLSMADMRLGFRLVGEVCECGDDVVGWRTRLTTGLCAAVGATKGFCEEEIVAREPAGSGVLGVAIYGFDAADMKVFAAFAREGHFHLSPLFPVIQPIATRPWTRTRRELLPDDTLWYGHPMTNRYPRPCDMDDFVHTRQPIPRPGWSNMCNIFRPWKSKPFSVRERRLVHLVHEETAHHWRKPAAPDPADALPRRLGQVVRLLRQGNGEKQVAFQLGLSPQTIHEYVKALYRKFGVSSRFDLLARLAPPPHPRRLVLDDRRTTTHGDVRR